jgi:allophanate hydrolase subunit 2
MELRSAGLPGGDRQLSGGARLFDGLIRYTAAEPRQELRYTVTNEVNRRGIRLQGPALEPGHEMITEGVNAGAIQVPPSGQPLIVFYDQTTTGGYPKLGTVIRADLDRLGQLRPRDTIRLQWIAVEDALQLARE